MISAKICVCVSKWLEKKQQEVKDDIMAYGSMSNVGIAFRIESAQMTHSEYVHYRLVKGLYEPYQSLASASINALLESNAEVPDWQVPKTGISSIF